MELLARLLLVVPKYLVGRSTLHVAPRLHYSWQLKMRNLERKRTEDIMKPKTLTDIGSRGLIIQPVAL